MTLPVILRVLGLVSFVVSMLIIATVVGVIGTWGTAPFFAVLGLALWLLSIIVTEV